MAGRGAKMSAAVGDMRKDVTRRDLLAFLSPEQFKEFLAACGGVGFVAELFHVHQAADASEGLDVIALLVGRAGEQDDEFDGLAIDGIKIHRLGGLADCHGEAGHACAFAVGNSEAKADAGGAGLLACPHCVLE